MIYETRYQKKYCCHLIWRVSGVLELTGIRESVSQSVRQSVGRFPRQSVGRFPRQSVGRFPNCLVTNIVRATDWSLIITAIFIFIGDEATDSHSLFMLIGEEDVMRRCAMRWNVDTMTFQCHPVTFRGQILSRLLFSSKFTQPFHFDREGRCDGVDVKCDEMLTLLPFNVILWPTE